MAEDFEPMSPEHLEALIGAQETLQNQWDIDAVLGPLVAKKVIEFQDEQRISSIANPTSYDRVKAFLLIFRGKDDRAFGKLIDILREKRQGHIAKVLLAAVSGNQNRQAASNATGTTGAASTAALTPEERQAELKKRIKNREHKLMTDAHRESIIQNLSWLSDNLGVANLIAPLLETQIILQNDAAMILSKPIPHQQNQYFLLNVFLQQGDWAFDELILILLNNGKQPLANLLDPEKKCPLRRLAA